MYVQGSAALTSFRVILANVSPPPLDVMGLRHAGMEVMKETAVSLTAANFL